MRDSDWECVNCGAVLEVMPNDVVHVIMSAKGGEPNYRVTMLRGKEIHRCELAGVTDRPHMRYRGPSASRPHGGSRRHRSDPNAT